MRLKKLSLVAVAIAAAVSLSLTGCATGSNGGNDNIVSVNGSEPQNPLITTNTNEVGGGLIVDNIYAGLVYYDADGAPVNEMAESITSTDNTNWTIKIKSGWKFTNGEEVTADSFVNAWKYGALFSNAQLNSYFFDAIEGFSYEKDTELTGLKVVSPTEFTVKLTSAQSDFPLRLGYTSFMPQPQAFFDDPKAFGENPIGNGPYKLAAEGAWKHNVDINLVKNPDYQGGRVAKNGGLKIVFYATLDAAYADLLADNLDVLAGIPDAALKTYKSDLGDRAVDQAAAIFQSITIPGRLAHFSGEEGKLRRAAISEAINRQEIIDVIFNGTRKPARDFTSPVIAGWSDSLEGANVLDYNAEDAKALWAKADAISKWSGKFEIGYNADGGHQGWIDAVANSIKNTLGIDAAGKAYPTFAEFRTDITDKTITAGFRTGWQADYPALANFLAPLYQTGAGANDGQYSSKEFDALIAKGNAATSLEDANKAYQDAQVVLLKDLPAIPMWYGVANGGYSTKVSDVKVGWNSVPVLHNIVKN
ncbi:ABC transporter substrate-binding protein [Rhodoluna sp.]|uniref:peptide ABC transporter substrate-binding protein n=1 Tax=Rhodoluna sp. TaxID=1969481 RepID=UPI0025FF9C01|nr:ABC transporter substrate-binding protein [Rhodoluna sp.]